MRLAHLFDHAHALPTIPKVVHQLIQSFNHEEVSIDEIASQITADPVISAKLLRLANSAYFHVTHKVSTVDDALRMLGFVMVRNLVVGSGLAGGFKATPSLNLNQFWSYCLGTAVTARWLGRLAGENTDLCFTVGLTHAIGELVMHAAMPEQMLFMDRTCSPIDPRRAEMETQSFGYHYADVGAELARRWHFPDEITEAIRHVPSPLEDESGGKVAAIVHLAAWRARVSEYRLGSEELVASYPGDVGQRLGIAPTWLPELAAEHAHLKPKAVMPPLEELLGGLQDLLH